MKFLRKHKWISILPVVGFMVIIFLFSAQNSTQSSELSRGAGNQVFRAIVKFLGVPEEEREAYVEAMQFPIRKGAHMAEYAVLGFLVGFSLFVYEIRGGKWYTLAQGITSFYAATDEVHQYFVPGRSCQLSDVLVDSIGGLFGICLLYLFLRKSRKRQTP